MLRDQLEDMLTRELLGPQAGPTEELLEAPSVRYFVGLLSPQRRVRPGQKTKAVKPLLRSDAPAADGSWLEISPEPSGSNPTDEEDDEDAELPAGDELALGGRDSTQDGSTDLSAAQERALFPCSLGMTFCVDESATGLAVSATFGQYLRVPSELHFHPESGKPRRVWKRVPRGGKQHVVPLRAGRIEALPVDDETPQVVIEGLVRRRADHFSVTLFLVNKQTEPERLRDQAWIFQPELAVSGAESTAVFCKKAVVVLQPSADVHARIEAERLAMLYRNQIEFAVGHGVSVHAEAEKTQGGRPTGRALRLVTRVLPRYQVPRSAPPRATDEGAHPALAKLEGLVLDMKELSVTPAAQLASKLRPLCEAYGAWIDHEERRVDDAASGLASYRAAAARAIADCREALARIGSGVRLLTEDKTAAEAFRFMNDAMWRQRTHSLFSEEFRRRDDKPNYNDYDITKNRTWYPFQLAFILLNLPGLSRFDHPERSEKPEAVADLLWFPTGGGKTEAYLGLTAYTLGLRRLQGVVEGRSGESGVAVLMRYTLRLLTLQQFQRATALICACEEIRRDALARGDARWGRTPFRIGLWVGGSSTPNWTEDSENVVNSLRGQRPGRASGSVGGVGSPHQLTNCPWCGSEVDPGKHIKVDPFASGSGRTLVYCGDRFGQCLFSEKKAEGEGLPVVVVDEEIYRLLPSLLITTVDKFAQMPWSGAVQMLFGQVSGRCDRHGFRSPEVEDRDSHPAKGRLPSARTVPLAPLRPPDLIIQDELHLISGPLGTLVGLYETAIDRLCTWEVGGKKVRPKVVASTATTRRARDQVHALFMRSLREFPPSGLDIRDNFFAVQRTPSQKEPGRLYLGVCAPGRRLKAALIRVYVALLAAGQALFDREGQRADPWMTLVGYFNSLRELGGMKRLVDDDVRTRLPRMAQRGLGSRALSPLESVRELTSRLASTSIPETLDQLERVFDPVQIAERREQRDKDRGQKAYKPAPIDVLLATNMISVGVNVSRLGLMVVAGQPKTTAEYIQATSRVGRDPPGLVVTVYNWARPRDLSHYETFEHYHATFYQHVEALSVTPFSAGATARGLAALLVALVRLSGIEFNANERAMLLGGNRGHRYVTDAIAAIVRRAEHVAGPAVADEVRQKLQRKADLWQRHAQRTAAGSQLGYQSRRDGVTIGLLRRPSIEPWDEFTCLNSLREVEPLTNLVLDDHHLDDEAGSETPPESSDAGGAA